MREQLLSFIKGFGRDDLLAVFGAALIFRGFWYWDPALSYISVGILALLLSLLASGILKRRGGGR